MCGCTRAIQLCAEAADIIIRIERQSDVIERRYNKLIEQKTVFASRAAARIRYIMQEGADGDDRTAVFVSLLNRSRVKEDILEALAEKIRMEHIVAADDARQSVPEKIREKRRLSLHRLWLKRNRRGQKRWILCPETAVYTPGDREVPEKE